MPLDSPESAAAWLRLTLTRGVGLESQRRLLSAFGPPERIFAAAGTAVRAAVGDRVARALAGFDGDDQVARTLDWAAQPGNHLVTLADPTYPQALLEIADPPTLLYVKGRVELLNARALAIVGARSACGPELPAMCAPRLRLPRGRPYPRAVSVALHCP